MNNDKSICYACALWLNCREFYKLSRVSYCNKYIPNNLIKVDKNETDIQSTDCREDINRT